MNKPMTLEEAVEIDRECSADSGMAARIGRERMTEWHRARAIVDQAVRAHKARCEFNDASAPAESANEFDARIRCYESFEKLRALELGESEVKP